MGIVSMFVVASRASCVGNPDVLLRRMAGVGMAGAPGASSSLLWFHVKHQCESQEEDSCGQ